MCDDNLIGINLEPPMVTILKDQIFLGHRLSSTFGKKSILWFYYNIHACKYKACLQTHTHPWRHTALFDIWQMSYYFFKCFKNSTLKHILPSMQPHVNFKEYKVYLWFIYTLTHQNVMPWETFDVQKTAGYFSSLSFLRHKITILANYKQNYLLVRFRSTQSWGGKCSLSVLYVERKRKRK